MRTIPIQKIASSFSIGIMRSARLWGSVLANEISCLKWEKTWANPNFQRHNFREVSPEYLLKNHALKNEYRTVFDPRSEYEKLDFSNKRGRKIEYAHTIREGILLLKDGTKLEEIQGAIKMIEDRLNLRCCSIAIHNDEGHVDKDSGETIYNTHAHLVFYTLTDEGKQNFRLTTIRPKLSKLQQDLAEELGMIKPKINSKRKGLSHAEFREVQEQLEQEKNKQKDLDQKQIEKLTLENTVLSNDKKSLNSELLTLKAQKAQIEEERKKYKEEGDHIAEEYRKLQALNKTKHTQEELDKALAELRKQYEERISAKDKEITELTDNNTVLSKSNKSLEEKLDNYTVLYNNSIHEQNLAQTDLRTFPTLEELTYERYNLETQYGIRQVYDYEKYRGEFSQEKSMQRLSERSMVHQRANSDLSMHSNEVSKLRDGDTADHQHKLLRSVYSETMIYSVNPQTDRVLSVEDQIRYNNIYSLAKKYADNLTSVAKKLGIKYENKEDQYLSNIQEKTVELCNTVLNKPKEIIKTVEVVKEVPREITTTDVENHVRFKALQQEKENLEKYYKEQLKPNLNDLHFEFLTVSDLEQLKPKTTKKVLGMPLMEESPQAVINRFNKVLEKRNEEVRLNYQKIKHKNTVLSNENNELKAENADLKSWKEIGLNLLHNFGFYIGEKLPSLEEVKSTVKSFTSRLFSAFMMRNDNDWDYVQTKIIDGQEYKQAQVEKQQQIEQQRREEIQKQKERAKQQQQKEQERGGMSL